MHEAVEVGGDQHIGAVLPLGNPVPQGGREQRQPIVLWRGGRGDKRSEGGSGEEGQLHLAFRRTAVFVLRSHKQHHLYEGSHPLTVAVPLPNSSMMIKDLLTHNLTAADT